VSALRKQLVDTTPTSFPYRWHHIRTAELDPEGLNQVSAPQCRKCFNDTIECKDCHGVGKVAYTFGPCTTCIGTGWVCQRDGKHWMEPNWP
jgi:RecJ-like exonuclease